MAIDSWDAPAREIYGPDIGRHWTELTTPALVLDLDAARRNIQRMSRRLAELHCAIRPHYKVHKTPHLARLQVEAGAIGISTATVWEAVVCIRSGLDHVFVVNTITSPDKVAFLARLAGEADLMVAVDDAANVRQLADATRAAGATLGVAIEVDTGMHRAGVGSAEEALALARAISSHAELRLMGVTGYEGHCSLTPERDPRLALQREAMTGLVDVAERLEAEGFPCPIRSAGGTATWDATAAFPGITEIQAGTYAVMDAFHGAMVQDFEPALYVVSTVISSRDDRLVVDAGSKTISDGELSRIMGYEDLHATRFDEEHGIFRSSGGRAPRLGEVVRLIPGYAPSTVNNFDAYHVLDGDRVAEIWAVVPRGPGHHGLADL